MTDETIGNRVSDGRARHAREHTTRTDRAKLEAPKRGEQATVQRGRALYQNRGKYAAADYDN